MDDSLQHLKDAVRESPQNVSLRQVLADTLRVRGHLDEAEREYAAALAIAPNNRKLKVGLATTYLARGADADAALIVDGLLALPEPPAEALLLHARILLKADDINNAIEAYRGAIRADRDLIDLNLERQMGISGESRLLSGPSGADPLARTLEKPTIRFSDVGGMEKLKEQARMKIILPLTKPDLFKAYGKKPGGSLLLYGPPGCGKTYLARATSGEAQMSFVSVGVSEVLDMWFGRSEQNLHAVFDLARRNRPCVLFFDEIDALGASRSDLRGQTGRQIINQFLSELDGAEWSNEGILILGATNTPWHMDSAFKRPGRFDQLMFVPPPDSDARAAILRILLRDKPVRGIDYDAIAAVADSYSGADLKAVVDSAIESKLADALRTGIQEALTTADLLSARKRVPPSTLDWLATARNYALHSNQGGHYDDLAAYLKLE